MPRLSLPAALLFYVIIDYIQKNKVNEGMKYAAAGAAAWWTDKGPTGHRIIRELHSEGLIDDFGPVWYLTPYACALIRGQRTECKHCGQLVGHEHGKACDKAGQEVEAD
jgi:hypothetical protein